MCSLIAPARLIKQLPGIVQMRFGGHVPFALRLPPCSSLVALWCIAWHLPSRALPFIPFIHFIPQLLCLLELARNLARFLLLIESSFYSAVGHPSRFRNLPFFFARSHAAIPILTDIKLTRFLCDASSDSQRNRRITAVFFLGTPQPARVTSKCGGKG
jgi:hypothetical protein